MRPQPSLARLLVWERTGLWATALKRALGAKGAKQVVEIRAREEAREDLATSPASFVLCEASAEKVEATLEFLVAAKADFPRAVFALVGERALAKYEWLIREAGAEVVCTSSRLIGDLARMAARHLARTPPRPEPDFGSWLAARLPWQGIG